MRYRPTCLATTGLAGVLTFFMAGNATAQRGGHGGGGGSHGGGGFHPSSGGVRGAPSFNRTPSFSMPRPSPQPGAGPGINRGISTAPRQITPGPSVGNVGRTPGAVGPGPGAGRNVNNSLGFGNRNPSFGQFGGINRGNLGGNPFANSGLGRMSPGRQGLGGSNLYLANHQGWMHGYWNGNHPGNSTWNHNYPGRWGGYGPYGYGAYGPSGYGRGYGSWGYPGWGFGSGLGLGIGLGWGLGGLGYGLGGLWGLGYGGYGGWGHPGYGYGGYGGYGLGGAGLGMGYGGWGLNSWAYGPSLYNWGYASYDNPYNNASSTGVDQPIVYDYSQPINPSAAPPAETVSDQAVSLFDQARTAFKNGDYTRALDLTNQALRQLPNDPALHEFRALVLFALQRFDEVAASLYAVLSVEPGWDWTTMIGLYPDVDVYTRQLRTLEAFVAQSPQSAAARFALAYHYLTQGHTEAAIAELKVVRQMEPKDTLAAQLLQQLEQPQEPSSTTPANASSVATANPRPSIPNNSGAAPAAEDRNLTGTWTAEAGAGTTITVSFPDARRFVWKVSRQGKTQEIQGERTSGDGILTLTQDNQAAQPPLVGRVTWQDDNHFNFKLLGGDPGDPGLTFTRSA